MGLILGIVVGLTRLGEELLDAPMQMLRTVPYPALIFLFFLRVIRAVWVEMSPATIRKPRSVRRQERREERATASAPS